MHNPISYSSFEIFASKLPEIRVNCLPFCRLTWKNKIYSVDVLHFQQQSFKNNAANVKHDFFAFCFKCLWLVHGIDAIKFSLKKKIQIKVKSQYPIEKKENRKRIERNTEKKMVLWLLQAFLLPMWVSKVLFDRHESRWS